MRIKEHEKERRQTHKKQEEENARGQTGARKSAKKQDDVTEVEDVNTRWKEKIERRRREKSCRNLKMNSTRKTPFVGNVMLRWQRAWWVRVEDGRDSSETNGDAV